MGSIATYLVWVLMSDLKPYFSLKQTEQHTTESTNLLVIFFSPYFFSYPKETEKSNTFQVSLYSKEVT